MKTNHLILLILVATLMISCTKQPTPEPTTIITESQLPAEQTGPTSACQNIFYPLRQDNQWVYRMEFDDQPVDGEQADVAISVAAVADNHAELGVLSYATGVVSISDVQCANGAILNFPFTELNAVFGDLDGTIDVAYESGVFMPSEREFNDAGWNHKWTTQYRAEGQIEARYEGEDLKAVFTDSPVRFDWEVVSTGGIRKVAAGDFDHVVHIRREAVIDVTSLQATVGGNQVKLGTTITMITNMYYAPGVGMLRQDFESAAIRLFGISFPIQASGGMELVSYNLNE